MSNLEIRQFLTLSIGHVTPETTVLLDSGEMPILGGTLSSYGWFFWAPEERGELPEDLWAVCELARANGCQYVLMDCDGPKIKELPYYDW